MKKDHLYVNKAVVVQTIIDKVENEQEVKEIKTNLVKGYEKPDTIIIKGRNQKGFSPDVITEMNGRTDLYEVELDSGNYLLEKWKMFYLFAKKTKGVFTIVTPEDNLDIIRELLKVHNIRAKLLYFT